MVYKLIAARPEAFKLPTDQEAALWERRSFGNLFIEGLRRVLKRSRPGARLLIRGSCLRGETSRRRRNLRRMSLAGWDVSTERSREL
jgi:hypothetical protein